MPRMNVKLYAQSIITNPVEFNCLDYIITNESHWNPKAHNPVSSAYGLGQLLSETDKDPYTQLFNLLRYAKHRYTSMCHAMAFHMRKGWW